MHSLGLATTYRNDENLNISAAC